MRLSALMDGLPLRPLSSGDAEVVAVTTDSREVGPGALFFAREGWFIDSHQFVGAAAEAGASAVVVTRADAASLAGDLPVYVSDQEDRDLGLVCDRFFSEPTLELKVFGVTGTNGKTSVSYMLEHMLSELGERPAVIGTVSHRFEGRVIPARNTTPDGRMIHGFARESANAGATALVVEVSSHGAVLERIAGVAFDSTGFTNLTADHLDFHKTFDEYSDAKRLLFTKFLRTSKERGKTVNATIFADDAAAKRMVDGVPAGTTVSSVGFESGQRRIEVVENLGAFGQRIRIADVEGVIPIIGEHNAVNAAVAVSMCVDTLGVSVAEALNALERFPGIPGRLERAYAFRTAEPPVFVDYAHSPDAVARVLPVLRGLGAGPTTCVLGCGGDRDVAKRSLMGRAAVEGCDSPVFTADNPRSEDPEKVIDQMLDGLDTAASARVARIPERAEAIDHAIRTGQGPTLIAGKGHETYQEVGGVRFHFDDREEVRRAVRGRRSETETRRVALLAGWSVERIAAACRGSVVRRGDTDCWGPLTTDSRAIERDGIFVALRGERFDGHTFVDAAATAGAGLVIVDDDSAGAEGLSVIRVADTLGALQSLATAVLHEGRRRRGGLRITGITGSNGKTTTKELLAALLGETTLATAGNFNNHIGLPLTAVRLAGGDRTAVLEMGANRVGDIHELVAIGCPDVGVVTSIGAAHLEGFGDLDGVRRAKAGIVAEGVETLVIPHAERAYADWRHDGKSWTFGLERDADLRVVRRAPFGPVRLVGSGSFSGFDVELEFPLPGLHNATNLAAACLGFAATTGALPTEDALERVAGTLELPAGRLRWLEIARRTVIDDAYNANPASMLASLSILQQTVAPRVAVLGAMRELGPASDARHREIGVAAAERADVVVTVGEDARAIAEGASSRLAFDSVDEAGRWLVENVSEGATLLLKASRGSRLERLIPILTDGWGSA